MNARTLLLTAAAVAALAPAAAEAQTRSAGASGEVNVLDQLIVTARKREENLGETPISGSVISADVARELVLDSTADIVRQLPATSLVVSGAESIGDISMRGQGVGRLGSSESTTGLYRNGISVAGGSFFGKTFNRMDLFDIERIESFRGPQGALYGRNAVGGSINVVSRHAGDETGGYAKLGYRTGVEAVSFEGVHNTALVPGLLNVRIGVIGERRDDGFYRRVEDGQPLDDTKFFGLRGSARLILGEGELNLSLEHLYAEGLTAGTLGYTRDSGDPSPYRRANLNSAIQSQTRDDTAFVEYDRSLGFADFSFVGNFKARRGSRYGEDIDHVQGIARSGADVRGDQWNRYERWGVEARFASPKSDSPWNWLFGADAQGSWEKQRTTQNIIRIPATLTAGQRAVVNALNNDRQVEDDLASYSAFGLIGYDLTEQLEATGELRVQHDKKTQRGINFRPTPTTVARYERERSFTEWTPVATLTYRPMDGHAFYLRYATGYRPGGFNDALLFQGGSTPGVSYDVEYNTSYEAGWKADLLDRRLHVEAAVFRTHTDDVQLVTRDPASGTTAATLLNVGESNIWGAEFTANGRFQVGPGRLNVIFSISTQQGEFTKGSGVLQAAGLLDLSDARVPRTRDYMANLTLSYTQPIAGTDWRWNVTTSSRVEGGGYENLAGGAKAANSNPLDSFEIHDLRVSAFNSRWRVSAFLKNITDQHYQTQALANLTGTANFPGGRFTTFWNEPRSAGVELTVNY